MLRLQNLPVCVSCRESCPLPLCTVLLRCWGTPTSACSAMPPPPARLPHHQPGPGKPSSSSALHGGRRSHGDVQGPPRSWSHGRAGLGWDSCAPRARPGLCALVSCPATRPACRLIGVRGRLTKAWALGQGRREQRWAGQGESRLDEGTAAASQEPCGVGCGHNLPLASGSRQFRDWFIPTPSSVACLPPGPSSPTAPQQPRSAHQEEEARLA